VKDDRLYPHHILERCQRVTRFVGPGKEAFMESTRARLAGLDCKAICGMRDVLIHDFIGVAL